MTRDHGSSEARIDSARGRFVLEETMRLMTSGGKVDRGLWKDFVQVHNQGFTSGLAVGDRAPGFGLPDQGGDRRGLADLSGPEGLLLTFVRSADW
jgi:hypothetical protein